MRLLERLAARLTPAHWPIRWRLAAVSAGLTFVILVVFALVIGRLVGDRLHDDFDNELRDTARRLAFEMQVGQRAVEPDPQDLALGIRVIRIVTADGDVFSGFTTSAQELGPPRPGELIEVGDLRVAAAPIQQSPLPPLYVQYARSTESLDSTVSRLWLFLAVGVLAGTALAALAGVAIAGRAMRPIAALTSTAREIATTRDPSRRVPEPESDDEVAELARTLNQMLRELDAARTETELMIQAQREFVADASHELRTPLTSILANLELLHDQISANANAADEEAAVASALRSSRRMRGLVADLLLLARADAGRTGVRRGVDLGEIAAAAVDEVRPVADGHELDLRLDGEAPLEGDPDELHRMALNLLDNGLRHTPAGTRIEVSVQRSNGNVVLEVVDDGPGIPPGLHEQVFARFVRGGGPADTAADAGTGLGLAIVKAVATSHGGHVEAGTSRSGGARFTVTLPLRRV